MSALRCGVFGRRNKEKHDLLSSIHHSSSPQSHSEPPLQSTNSYSSSQPRRSKQQQQQNYQENQVSFVTNPKLTAHRQRSDHLTRTSIQSDNNHHHHHSRQTGKHQPLHHERTPDPFEARRREIGNRSYVRNVNYNNSPDTVSVNFSMLGLEPKQKSSESTLTTTASSTASGPEEEDASVDDNENGDDGVLTGDDYFTKEDEDERNYEFDPRANGSMRVRTSTSRLPSMYANRDVEIYDREPPRPVALHSHSESTLTSSKTSSNRNFSKTSSSSNVLSSNPTTTSSSNPTISTMTTSSRALLRRENRAERARINAIKDREFCRKKLMQSVVVNGDSSVQTANCLLDLGASHLIIKEFSEALSVFKKSIRIIRKVYGEESLAMARALSCVGMAACKLPNHRKWALISLNEALHIRYKQLGPCHVDTIDTLNNMAGCYVQMRSWEEAKEAYEEVLYLRACIFGKRHASVAVTARMLASVHTKLGEWDVATAKYEFAIDILTGPTMLLKQTDPMVQRVRRDILAIQRMARMG